MWYMDMYSDILVVFHVWKNERKKIIDLNAVAFRKF